ncbi:M28 family metallopeptidase [Solicola gregarius]|uniref:M20/M25/M40 family metallo-hydrolase n=1 Tax=Solicola gregarius TaxID=2908642 RepID=A0AA46TJU0_9ACTN|nr:M20/M25/M40 family metallo-hydrolase [Solicola gregarius]UYM06438.1 M20/M25/M40 family metallo-hydrolase [Solicola gregarius]
MRRGRTLVAGIASALAATTLTVSAEPAVAVDNVNTKNLREAVTVSGILQHERVLQRIANDNDGTRASGTPGYKASAKYVKRTLRRAGYKVSQQRFTFPFFQELAPATLEQTAPTPTEYETATFSFSGSGDVTGTVVPIDVMIPPPTEPGSTSGCEPGDFPAAPAGPAIALIQRGSCDFGVKAANAQDAGYDAAIIFNEGQEGRTELIVGTLGAPVDIPVVGLSFADGEALYNATQSGDVEMQVTTETETRLGAKTTNVFAESRAGDPKKTVVVGAHLDSVTEGPGINDNGSGTATLLEIAEQMADLKQQPRQRVRFAFWGAEEPGLLGSEHYVANLPNRELRKIVANLNFDMLGSPNYARFVYDGDGSDTDTAGPPGSAQIEGIFNNYFAGQGMATDPTAFDGRSDYGPFIAAGIPAGGLFSGAEGIMTPEQAEAYGGTAGEPYDSCYHQACDDITNLSTAALNELGDAAAHATWTLARTKSGFFEDGSMRHGKYRAPKGAYDGDLLRR